MNAIQHALTLEVPVAVLFKAVTFREGLRGWWTQGLEGAGTRRSPWIFRFASGAFNSMEVVHVALYRSLEWKCVDGAEEWIDTHVKFHMKTGQNGTELLFIHANWREASDYMHACGRHWKEYMISLKDYCESGRGSPDCGPVPSS